jgi:hypothetical protein
MIFKGTSKELADLTCRFWGQPWWPTGLVVLYVDTANDCQPVWCLNEPDSLPGTRLAIRHGVAAALIFGNIMANLPYHYLVPQWRDFKPTGEYDIWKHADYDGSQMVSEGQSMLHAALAAIEADRVSNSPR